MPYQIKHIPKYYVFPKTVRSLFLHKFPNIWNILWSSENYHNQLLHTFKSKYQYACFMHLLDRVCKVIAQTYLQTNRQHHFAARPVGISRTIVDHLFTLWICNHQFNNFHCSTYMTGPVLVTVQLQYCDKLACLWTTSSRISEMICCLCGESHCVWSKINNVLLVVSNCQVYQF